MASSDSMYSALLLVLVGFESNVVSWGKAQQGLLEKNPMNKSTVEDSILG